MNSNWQATTKIWTAITEKLALWSENLEIDLQEMPRDNNIQSSNLVKWSVRKSGQFMLREKT